MLSLNFKTKPPQITGPVLALIFSALLILSGIIGFTMYRMDVQDAIAKNNLIRAVIDAELQRIGNGVKAYANWDDAVLNYMKDYNAEWIKKNFDDIVLGEQHVDYFLVYDDKNKLIHPFPENTASPKMLQTIEAMFPKLRALAGKDNTTTLSGTMINDTGELSTVGMRLITAVSDKIPDAYQHGILVFVNEIKDDDLLNLEKRMTVNTISPRPDSFIETDHSVRVFGPLGDPAGYLVWSAASPSAFFLKDAAMPLAIGILVILSLAAFVLMQEQNAIHALVRTESTIRLLAAALAASRTPIMILKHMKNTGDFLIAYANPAAAEMYGYATHELDGQPLERLNGDGTHPTHKELLENILAKTQAVRLEILHARADGSNFWNELILSPIISSTHPSENFVEGFIVVMRDISTERRMRELASQRDRMLSLGQLAGSVAHELNNLLQPAMTYAELLYNQPQFSDPLTQESLGNILNSCRQATKIIRNVLTFSRQGEIQLRYMPLGDAIKRVIELIRPLIPSKLMLQIGDLSKINDFANNSENQMTQLLSQLLLNAAWATDRRGTVGIHLRRVPDPAALATRHSLPPSSFADLAIADNGIGMDKATLGRALEPFFTTKPPGQGTGLGLSTVDSIVKSWGGAVEIESEKGKGTVVHIYVPIKPE